MESKDRLAALAVTVYQGNSLELIKAVDESVHLILSDIPYGIGTEDWDVLHYNANSTYLSSSAQRTLARSLRNAANQSTVGRKRMSRAKQYQEWCSQWTPEWYRVLKPGANVFIFAGRRLARCACAMEDAGFSLRDNLAWIRTRAPHRAQRLSVVYDRRGDTDSAEAWKGWQLKPSSDLSQLCGSSNPTRSAQRLPTMFSSMVSALTTSKHFSDMLKSPRTSSNVDWTRGKVGFITQKSVRLMQALIELTTREEQLVLDPFAGSGSTLVAAKNLSRRYMGFEAMPEYVETCKKRISPNLLFD